MTRSSPTFASRLKVPAIASLAALLISSGAHAQYMYLDANGDGVWTQADSLNVPGTTRIDIWLRTNMNKDGSGATCPSGQAFTLNSYTFLLRAADGTVAWGPYTNNQPVMGTSIGITTTPTAHRAGFLGGTILAAGTYKLGSVNVFVTSGRPRLDLAAQDSSGDYVTTFGSSCAGADADNTLKLGQDWSDTDGVMATASVLTVQTFDGSTAIPLGWQTTESSQQNNEVWSITSYLDPLGNSATGVSPSYYCGYPANVNNSLSLSSSSPAYVSEFKFYQFSFLEVHSLWGEDYAANNYFYYTYNVGSNPSNMQNQGAVELTEDVSGWTRQTGAVVNNADRSKSYMRPIFGLLTFTNSAPGCEGVWLDSIQIYGTRFPDLLVASASLSPLGGATSLTAGDSCRLTYRIRNLGDLSTANTSPGTFAVRAWVHRTGSDTELGIFSHTALAATESLTVTRNILLNTPATYTLNLRVDNSNSIVESNLDDDPENNNVFTSSPITYTFSPRPDIVIDSVRVVEYIPPAAASLRSGASRASASDTLNLRIGRTYDYRVYLRNPGSQDITTPFRVGWYRDLDSPPTFLGPAPDDSFGIAALPAGATRVVEFRKTSTQSGLWRSYMMADHTNAVWPELNEDNNVAGPVVVRWAANVIYVRGRFSFSDSLWGGLRTIGCTDVVLYEWDSPTKADSLRVASVVSDSGHFYFPGIINVDDDGGYLDLFVRVKYRSNENCWNSAYPGNWFLSVEKPTPDSVWYHDSGGFQDVQDSDLDVGVVEPQTEGQRAALHVLNVLISEGWSPIRNATPATERIPRVVVRYSPTQSEGSYALGGIVYVLGVDGANWGPDPYDDAVLVHEYAHVILDSLGIPQASTSHDIRGLIGRWGAWTEGLCDFLGAIKGNKPGMPQFGFYSDRGRTTDGTLNGLLWNVETDSFYISIPEGPDWAGGVGSFLKLGPRSEGSIAAALWDVYDSSQEPAGINRYADLSNEQFSEIWGTLRKARTGAQFPDVHAFEAEFLAPLPYDRRNAARNIFWNYGISSTTDPDSAYTITGVDATPVVEERMVVVHGAYPNPVRSSVGIRFALGRNASSGAKLRVYDTNGRLVWDTHLVNLSPGVSVFHWNGRTKSGIDVASGVYFYEIESESMRDSAKFVVIR